ncbi:MAG TPA: LL-diaminopimelate aminotransferase [Anaerolineae bacterium]|nr:LL-diaminopimelate aminotransferase [Anaerolineae bacterium]
MELARRIDNLPPYLFAEIDKRIAEKRAQGVDVISLGIGDPVEPTPQNIINTLSEAANDPKTHRYPSYYGMPAFRRSIADWYKRRFNVDLNPDTEILPLIGSKEGIAHINFAVLDPGDTTLIADPGYPVYNTGAILAGVSPIHIPLLEENDFLPDLGSIDAATAKAAKMFLLNYPNNPTSAVANDAFFKELVDWAQKNHVIIAHDNPYSEITFDGYNAPSFLQYPGAKEVGVEFHSLSKTYNMTGWRIGWACGNAKVIEALGRVKSNIDSGIFNAIQYAGIEALEGPQDIIGEMRAIYQRRRDLVMETLDKIGLKARKPLATIYVWAKVPDGYTSASFTTYVFDKTGVAVAPGNGYGPSGEGYIRLCLSVKDDQLAEALDRIKSSL